MEADRFSGKGTMVRLLGFALSGKMFTGPGKISSVTGEGKVTDLVTGLPGYGDHFNNQLAPGPDGKIYFGQGAATSSGVVGLDNGYPFVWLLLPGYFLWKIVYGTRGQ